MHDVRHSQHEITHTTYLLNYYTTQLEFECDPDAGGAFPHGKTWNMYTYL